MNFYHLLLADIDNKKDILELVFDSINKILGSSKTTTNLPVSGSSESQGMGGVRKEGNTTYIDLDKAPMDFIKGMVNKINHNKPIS